MDAEWFRRIEAERRAGNITRAQRDVLLALGRLIAIGEDKPSEARLVSESGTSRNTVQRAKVRARELGLLNWERRFDSTGGLRRERPCAYRAETPTAPVVRREPQPRARKGTERRMLRSVRVQIESCGLPTPAMLALQHARRVRLGLAMR